MLHDKLNRLSGHSAAFRENSHESEEPERYRTIADLLKGELRSSAAGSFVKIVTDFDKTYSHGGAAIGELGNRIPIKKIYFHGIDDDCVVDSRSLLFFDIETTGLGGAGTVLFLAGFGSIVEGDFQVRQYFLPDYPDEAAMLEAVREEIKEDTIIVSYNGKSFDWPILTDRMILHRVERNLECAGHIDLLYSVRRLFRRRLQDCTLTNVEKHVLDFHRYDDIPGYLVPSIYFNWLSTSDPEGLAGVVKHNLNDIVSLYFILHRLAGVQENPPETISEPDDVLSLARILEKRREHEDICRMLEDLDKVSGAYGRSDIMYLQSLAYRRSGKIVEAVRLWDRIAA
ncbi:MAG: ribonuclease H-like domain-containing protein, partial [Candidatus Zixiibacteriota bacterium]